MTSRRAPEQLRHGALVGTARDIAGRRDRSVAIVVPTVDEAATIGPICAALVELRRLGACDRVLVVDHSTDLTTEVAAAAGADVLQQAELLPEAGPVLGKGDAMWRALSACSEDVVVFVDGDTEDFDPAIATGLIAATATAAGDADFAKATFRRPWRTAERVEPTGGGRVTELTAKPLLRLLFPELARFGQPLAGEIAGRASLLRTLPFVTGYGVDVALLIDAWHAVGDEGLAEIQADVRQNRHRPLAELSATADQVATAILSRAGVIDPGRVPERPPLDPAGRELLRLAV